MSQTYYHLLGVARNATEAEIKRAYRAKMRQYHPDSFAAEKQRLTLAGLALPLRELEQEIAEAKRKTQQINLAYTTLSDVDKRRAYDATLALQTNRNINQKSTQQRQRHPEKQRRTVKARPHRPPHQRQAAAGVPQTTTGDKMLGAFFVIFIMALVFLFGQLATFFAAPKGDPNYALSAEGIATLTARAEIATQTALELESSYYRVLTQRAITQAAELDSRVDNLPTPTMSADSTARPRTLTEQAETAMSIGMVDLAADLYTRIIESERYDAQTFFARGRAYHLGMLEGLNPDEAAMLALSDYNRAVVLDDQLIDVYGWRGLLRFQLSQEPDLAPDLQSEALIQQARGDLRYYLQNTDNPDPLIQQAVNDLETELHSENRQN